MKQRLLSWLRHRLIRLLELDLRGKLLARLYTAESAAELPNRYQRGGGRYGRPRQQHKR